MYERDTAWPMALMVINTTIEIKVTIWVDLFWPSLMNIKYKTPTPKTEVIVVKPSGDIREKGNNKSESLYKFNFSPKTDILGQSSGIKVNNESIYPPPK